MRVDPYLYFDGDCAAAFRFYADVLGCAEPVLMPYGEGAPCAEGHSPAPDRIMHACIGIGEQYLMASDVPPGTPLPNAPHAFVALGADSDADAERMFAALADGGEIRAPMEETFFAHRFGMTVDRFGTGWMVLRAKSC